MKIVIELGLPQTIFVIVNVAANVAAIKQNRQYFTVLYDC